MRFTVGRRPDPTLDVTPMIDVVFQLLLFFMVTTTFISSAGIDVDLPRSSSEVVISGKDDLQIWMTAEGAVYVDDQPIDLPDLRKLLESKGKNSPNTTVVIKADQGVTHGRVVSIMDLARGYGLSRLAIATEAEQK